MFARAGIVVLVLASPAQGDSEIPLASSNAHRSTAPAIPLRYRNDPNGDQTPVWPVLRRRSQLLRIGGSYEQRRPWRGLRGPKSNPVDGEHAKVVGR